MPTYAFVATDADGKKHKGERDAATEEALRYELLGQNLAVSSIKEKKKLLEFELAPQKVKVTDIMHFSRQIGAFVKSGIPITEALIVVEEGTDNKRWKKLVAEMRDNIEAGVPFSDAVAEHSQLFPPYYLGILRSAELTGQLDTALDQLAEYMDRDVEARHTIKSALTYPLVIAVMSVLTVVILATFVLPKFVKFFKGFHAKLPVTTKALIWVADFFKTFWFVTPITFFAIGALVFWMRKKPKGQVVRDKMLLKLPGIGTIVEYAVVERFCRIMGAMVAAGVPLPDAMVSALAAANNRVFAARLQKAQERMLEGEGIAEPIADSELFPRAAVQMIRVGENTGTLEVQLANVAEYYGRELHFKLKKLTSLFEPAVIIFMGGIVGFVAVALISAMYGVLSGQQKQGNGLR
jgi:type IV pilus assembly protein PilC